MKLRTLIVTLTVLVGVTFLLASLSLAFAIRERDQRVAENTRHIAESIRRQDRNCERITAIVNLLDHLTPDVSLQNKLDEIDSRYPDVPPCPAKRKEHRP